MRGRIQVRWRCANQVRAQTQRDWLNLQLQGRSYTEHDIPEISQRIVGAVNEWITRADVSFDTTAERDTIKTLAEARQGSDPFILAGSYYAVHECNHDESQNGCAATYVKTVKP